MVTTVNYSASKTMSLFHRDTHFVRGLMGPIGSGKSVACCVEMLRLAQLQEPDEDNFRKTRWAVVRNTYRELIDTTMETFFDWIPKHLGVWRAGDMKFTLIQGLPDNTTLHVEFLFRALDKPDDIKKLLSLDLTGIWLNEGREIPKAVLDMGVGRCGRYPKKELDKGFNGATWWGVITDTNPPDSDHWWYKLFEVDCPDTYKLFKQPSGLSPDAENVANLPDRYYENMMAGKTQEWINVYVNGAYGFITTGKPVYPEYQDDVHAISDSYMPSPDITIYVGIDFGLTPAAVFYQQSPTGRWYAFDEFVTEDMGAKQFGELLNKKCQKQYPNFEFEFYGDPSGDFRAQTDAITPFQILFATGINAWPTYTNDPMIRREAVASTMMRMDFVGQPGLAITPGAPEYRKALAGGYHMRRMAVTGIDRFMDKPDKGKYSHVAEAGQYAMLGAGEGHALIETEDWKKPIDYSKQARSIV